MEKYLDQELVNYCRSDVYPYHMPGHKRQPLGQWTPESVDITEIDGFDNLHHAEEILLEGQQRLARVFGAEESFFLVNGSTCGLLAAICGSVKKGDTILVSRNCHKAVYHAIYLMELKAEYLYPEMTSCGIQGSIRPEQVAKKLKACPEASAVVITSPTYDGVVSDIAGIAEAVHESGIPLIVDEAHGAHFGFSDGFPDKAMAFGADLVIESVHKTLPAFTQTAVLHMSHNERVKRDRVKRYLGIYQTSSPSYVLMAGIDRCVRILQEDGAQLFETLERRLTDFYQKCSDFSRIRVYDPKEQEEGIWMRDGSKILMSAERLGWSGQKLSQVLRERYHLEMEMASGHYVTAIMTIMDTGEGFDRLYRALAEIDSCETALAEEAGERVITACQIYPKAQKILELSTAMDSEVTEVPLWSAAGQIAGEFVYLYPPGIPILAPGERITEEILDNLKICREQGMKLEGMQDLEGQNILVVKSLFSIG